ncbi:Myb-like DNA-binding domain protein (macronuclear) [Tetrahymena thermophila SB210]|uniref:Myb-like DNA-binding domain protein n=1 Tax=Tetrahymena thermophila (strain SB210) TaxID=312017 RepID=W7XDW0_TETTS|nr:Myb-like DNA-binding domain protein [Tetrahymena thermophila SB210]EWS71014.1 Myb-like DNA-binding domain protein [Tetrahymena thermophila SB210]|eukprot:XP_012656455.1 Myb-like DNA-binding domain protein [Tetrahymena thermophila SB210]
MIKLKKSFQKVDIFGVNLTFRILNERSNKTWIGGIITVIISGLMLYQIQDLIQSLIKQESPQVVQQQNYVYQPELFSINPKTFSFAFGMQNSVGAHFKNETIYKIIGIQQENHRVFNQTTNNYDLITVFKEIKIESCTTEHFQIDDVRDYFLKLPLKNLYCISLEQGDLSVEGEFSAVVFKQINLQVVECTQQNCTDSQARQTILSNSRLAIYTSDNIVQVTNKDKPYKLVGKNLFWIYSTFLEYEIRYQIINNYLYTDKGIVTTHNTTDRVVNYSSDRVQVYGKTTSRMFNFYIVYEKNKEIAYFRRGLLSRPISQVELNRKLINKLFDFDDTQQVIENQKEIQQQNCNNHKNFPQQTRITKKQQSSPKRQSQHLDNLNQGDIDRKKKELQKTIKNQTNLETNQSKQSDEDKMKKKFNLTDYFISIFSFFSNVFRVINKLIEFEKLKNLLLNEEQLKLFDYLPKPKLIHNQIKSSTQIPKQRKKSFSASLRRNDTVNSLNFQQTQQQNDFIITVEKTKDEKLRDAMEAFNIIQGRLCYLRFSQHSCFQQQKQQNQFLAVDSR